jgi:hypothetical protein
MSYFIIFLHIIYHIISHHITKLNTVLTIIVDHDFHASEVCSTKKLESALPTATALVADDQANARIELPDPVCCVVLLCVVMCCYVMLCYVMLNKKGNKKGRESKGISRHSNDL